jgi:hypothetical protein
LNDKHSFFSPIFSFFSSSIIFLVLLASFFALNYYPLLPVSFAGGRPLPVQLIIESGKANYLEQLIGIEENVSEIVYLIEKGTKFYYILSPSNIHAGKFQPLEISSSLVEGIFHPVEVELPTFVTEKYRKNIFKNDNLDTNKQE